MNVTFKPTGMYSPTQNKINRQNTQSKNNADETQKAQENTSAQDAHAEKKTRLEQLREQRKQEYDSTMQQLEQMREAEKQAEKSGKKFTDYGKLLKIAMRIMNGDKVPMADRKKLAEEMPDLYKQATLMRRTDNDKPKKYKSEYEDDKDKSTVEKMLDGMDGSDDPSDIMTDLLGSTDK
ncbi:MAG: hypothetical protein J6L61_11595 [Ruminiclostridium sp.]|nr:hypothetical protein [Ruminiclostridium sp.]